MATVEERALQALKNYISSEQWQKNAKKHKKIHEILQNATADNIVFGGKPKFVLGRVVGNATGVGESTYGDTTTRRTVSMNFTSGQKCFVDLGCTADEGTLERAYKKNFTGSKYYHQREASEIAESVGGSEVRSHLYDLNFTPKSTRINRYHIEYTSEVYTYKLWAIYVTYQKGRKQKQIKIGYWDEMDCDTKIDIDVDIPLTFGEKVLATLITIAIWGGIIALASFLLSWIFG
ncbi:MAG: hypothetical protein IKC52_06020 [Clostridia bacterium]|nr:hypothetical protein [Clostridia bacterium]